MKQLPLVLLALLAAACSGPSAPSNPYPDVAGSYAGTITLAVAGAGSLSCAATTNVTQSGASISMSPLTLGGVCAANGLTSFPLGDATISTTGSLGNVTQNNIPVASCGGTYGGTMSGGFFGQSFQFSMLFTPTSGSCLFNPGSFSFSGTLNR